MRAGGSRLSDDNVARYYDSHAEKEAGRLVRDAYHGLEFGVTLHYLERYLPERGKVLDLGGGSGRYSVELAKKGYRLTLADISQNLLDIAEREFEASGVMEMIDSLDRIDARDLSRYENASFEAIVALGPIYHLPDIRDREQAMGEIVRVARRRAPVFISAISKFGVYRTLLIRPELHCEFTEKRHLEEMIGGGVHRAAWHDDPDVFPDAWFCTPDELVGLAEAHGLHTLELAGLEGLSSHHREETGLLRLNEAAWDVWWRLIIETSNEPSMVGSSEHLLYVGEKA